MHLLLEPQPPSDSSFGEEDAPAELTSAAVKDAAVQDAIFCATQKYFV